MTRIGKNSSRPSANQASFSTVSPTRPARMMCARYTSPKTARRYSRNASENFHEKGRNAQPGVHSLSGSDTLHEIQAISLVFAQSLHCSPDWSGYLVEHVWTCFMAGVAST